MKITKPKIYDKAWGHEQWIVNNEKYCGKILTLKEGYRCSIHRHQLKTETFFVLSGRIKLELENEDGVMEESVLKPNDTVTIEPGRRHRFTGLRVGGSRILEVSTQHFEYDSYRDTESGKV